MSKYLINKLTTNVSLVDNRIRIAPLGSVQVSQAELEHSDVIDAIRRNWVRESDVPTSQPAASGPTIEFQKSPLEGSPTPFFDEPKVEAKEPAPVVEATVEESKTESTKRGRKPAEK